MGADFNTITYRGDFTKTEVSNFFTDLQEQCRYENGHSYSGGFGMAQGLVFVARVFDTEDLADEWVCDNAEKWGPAVAVRYKKPDGTEDWFIGAWCSS